MSKSGAQVNPECIQAYNELKLGKKANYVIFKMSDDYKEIVVEETGKDENWDNFRTKLIDAKSSFKGKEGAGSRYAVYDFNYELAGGEGSRSKIVFISWSPDEGQLMMPKMTYASSKEALKNALTGIGGEVQANSPDDIEYSVILKDISKGKA